MAILNDSISNSVPKYILWQPVVKGRYGGQKILKSRINHNVNFDNYNVIDTNVIEYFKTYSDVIFALCLIGHMYSARINPNGYEIRGIANKRFLNSPTLEHKNIKIIVCSKTKPMSSKFLEFCFDEAMFDSYLDNIPIVNPNYIRKEEHWIIQIFKGTWNNTEIISNSDSREPETPIVDMLDPPQTEFNIDEPVTIFSNEDKLFSVLDLSNKIFGPYQPCNINALEFSKNSDTAFDIQVVQYDDVGNSTYSYIPLPYHMITKSEFDFLKGLRTFIHVHPKNSISVASGDISQIEYIELVHYQSRQLPIPEPAFIEVFDLNEPEVSQLDSSPIAGDVNDIDVSNRNDMVRKYFSQYQPCVLTSIDYSNITGHLYSINLLRHNQDGTPVSLNILIPTSTVRDKEKNFFNEFQNNLRKQKFIRIVNSRITFVDDSNTDFEELELTPVLDDQYYSQDDEDYDIETIWTQATLIYNHVDTIDDEFNIEFEHLPKSQQELKNQARKFFYNTFKDTPSNAALTFAIQNCGRTVALLYDDIEEPKGRKVFYGSNIEYFDPDIRQIIRDCIAKKITFFNANSQLVGKVYCKQSNTVKERVFLSLI